jgi:hypothetical protein
MIAYNKDLVAWAFEQARFLRERRFDILDIEHLADEIEGVAKGKVRELVLQISELLAYLLKWQYLPTERTDDWMTMIAARRSEILGAVWSSPTLREATEDPETLQLIWARGLAQATSENERDCFPDDSPWAMDDVLSEGWLPT